MQPPAWLKTKACYINRDGLEVCVGTEEGNAIATLRLLERGDGKAVIP